MKLTDYVLIIVMILCAMLGTALVVDDVNTRWNRSYAVVNTADPNLSDALDCVVHIKAGGTEGSGCFVSADGIVLTARHVLAGTDPNKIVVTLRNGLTYTATAVYTPPETGPLAGPDIGFVKVDCYHPTRYLDVQFDRPTLGDAVWCLGHPYGKAACPWTVTRGVVSSLERDCKGAFGPVVAYQIDAAAFSGNSGGPVIDVRGSVVGVLVGSFNGRESLSVCIPSGRVLPWIDVFESLRKTQP